MTRTLTVLTTALLGATLFFGAGCEDTKCKADLQAAQAAAETAQKSLAAKQAEADNLKAQLTAAQGQLAKLRADADNAAKAAAEAAAKAAAEQSAPAKGGKPAKK